MKINSISASSKSYPSRLRNIPEKPLKIFVRGTMPDDRPAVAIVGTRKPTSYGKYVTTQLAEGLARRGVVIVSGMAIGIDGIAHEAALGAGGRTVAVLGCGVDMFYPARHRQLGEDILSGGGAVLSEYEPGMPALQHHFLARNRIVTGLCDALIVTEATTRSGTMNTVSHALAQGRDVYAVPGPITSPTSAGCNALIAQGAQPIVDIEAFINQFAPLEKQTARQSLLGQNEAEQRILELLEAGISDGETLQLQSKLEAKVYLQTMTMLEIRGAIRPLGANHWSL
jgi:DNA processing protein